MIPLREERDAVSSTNASTNSIESYRFLYGVLMASDLDGQGIEEEVDVWGGENGHSNLFLLLPSTLTAR